MKSPLILIIFDGLGINPIKEGNAVALAKTPTFDELYKEYPSSQLLAHGENVGLPKGQIGNSEVGHMNMGAGRIIYQDLTSISRLIKEGDFFKNQTLIEAINLAKLKNSNLHLMGLLSDGGVHSSLEHLFALLKLSQQQKLKNVFIHCFLDGRDTSPTGSLSYLNALETKTKELGVGTLATLCGRYYAMDRDRRWDRIQLAYELLTEGKGKREPSFEKAIHDSYEAKETDEFVKPVLLNEVGRICDQDVIIFFNFRPDRARQITRTFTEEGFSEFKKNKFPKLSSFVCFTQYDKKFTLPIAFPPTKHEHILAQILSEKKIQQFRCAETEKYAHVTYFFNCGVEKPFDLEERCLIDSPRDVPTYDLKPEMSAGGITEAVLKALEKNQHDFYVVNFANPDMVGHTGNLKASIKAMEVVDLCLGQILKKVLQKNGMALITADHGNVEQLIYYDTKKPHTAHTTNPVPLIFVSQKWKKARLENGILSNITPTILDILEIEKPKEVTQTSLLTKK